MATVTTTTHRGTPATGTSPASSDPLDVCRGLALAIPLSLLLWVALVRVAWGLWRG